MKIGSTIVSYYLIYPLLNRYNLGQATKTLPECLNSARYLLVLLVLNIISFHLRPGQESQKVFSANYPIDTEASKVKVSELELVSHTNSNMKAWIHKNLPEITISPNAIWYEWLCFVKWRVSFSFLTLNFTHFAALYSLLLITWRYNCHGALLL